MKTSRGCIIEISDTQKHMTVDHPSLRRLVESVLDGERVDAESVSIALVDDPGIHRVNREYLDHDCPTDVVSFVLSDPDEPLSGELVVSTETALRIAQEIGAEPWNELALYVTHGLLHLCGYDDLDEASAVEMRSREETALARAGLSNPFPLRRPSSD